MRKQSGIALLPVVIIITVIAAVSILLSYESSMNVNEAAAQNESKQADLVAEAGMAHAKWQLQQNSTCSGYSGLSSTNFGTHSYTASVSPNNGSPITLSADGVSNTGITRTLLDTEMTMYQASFTKEFILDENGQDSFIEGESGHTDHNKGDDVNILVVSETGKEERGLLQFDLTNIPTNSKILEATLELYLEDTKGTDDEIAIHRITDDWVEDEVTWKEKRSAIFGFGNWNPAGGEYVATVSGTFTADNKIGWKSAEITQLVQDWVKVPSINHGMILLAPLTNNNNEKSFVSSDDNDVTLHPKLTVMYACECGELCLDPEKSKLLFVVPNPDNLNTDDRERKELIESWGYAVTLIDDADSQSEFDDAVAGNNVVYITESIDSGKVSDKLRDSVIGVISEERGLTDDFGLSSDFISPTETSVEIINTSHYITSGFSNGTLEISSTSQVFGNLNGTIANGIQVLAENTNNKPAVSVIDIGGVLYDSGTATGRRVQLPWSEGGFNFSDLTDDAKMLMRRSIEWAAGAENEVTDTSLVAHWKLDETSGLVASESINGFDGVLENNPEWDAAGKIEGALLFDNPNAQFVVPHHDQLSPTKAITMSAWIFNDAIWLVDSYRIISKESIGTNDNYFLSLGSNQLYMGIGDEIFTPGIDFETDTWYHVAGTFDDDADEVRMYIDGVEVLVESTNAQMLGNTDNLYIGSNWEEYKWWEGLLDEVRLYDRALTAAEIEEIFNSAPVEGAGEGSKSAPPDPPLESCSGNYLDEFNADESYAGDDGTLKWSIDWQEINENNGAGSGDEQVRSDLGRDYVLRVRDNDGGGEGVEREADLSSYTNATLSFLYSRSSLDNSNDYVKIEVSANGGSSWNEVDRIEGPADDSSYLNYNQDISAFISKNTRIRFVTASTMGSTDEVYFDDVQIEVSGCVD